MSNPTRFALAILMGLASVYLVGLFITLDPTWAIASVMGRFLFLDASVIPAMASAWWLKGLSK